jgi:hypothetical protein
MRQNITPSIDGLSIACLPFWHGALRACTGRPIEIEGLLLSDLFRAKRLAPGASYGLDSRRGELPDFLVEGSHPISCETLSSKQCTASLINPFPGGLETDCAQAAPLIYPPRPSPFCSHHRLLPKCLLHKLSIAKTVLPTPPQTAPLSQSHTQLSALAPLAPSFSRVCADPHSGYLI